MNFRTFFADAPGWVLVLLSLVLLGNVAGLLAVGVHTDEAYYWVWSRRLDLGYYDHPPMVAWLVRVFSELVGSGVLGLRLPAVAAWAVTLYVSFKISSSLYRHPAAGWLSVLIVASLPIFQVGFHIVGPDSPLMLFSALTYYFVYKAVLETDSRAWLLAGLCLGLSLLGKYTAVLLPGIVFIALVSNPGNRLELKKPYPWIALVLATLIFMPVVVWNYVNEWISFSYQWGHGTATNKGFSIYKILDYLSQQMGAVLPWVLVAMAVATFRPGKYQDESSANLRPLFIAGFWVPLLFFGVTGAVSKSMHNWPVIAYIPGAILLAGSLASWLYPATIREERGRQSRAAARYAVVISTVFSILLVNLARFPQWASLLEKPERLAGSSIVAVWGWNVLADGIRTIESEDKLPADCNLLFIKEYNNSGLGYFHAAGEMAFHLQNEKRVLLERTPHFKQYNFWKDKINYREKKVCLVIAGPASNSEFPLTFVHGELGHLERRRTIAIVAPDTTTTHYAIYVLRDDK